jgi:putative ABC transport system ATP-binding protein
MGIIELSKISKIYKLGKIKVPALSLVSLEIEPHEFLSIMGPSGSGKSTLMNILGCLDHPSSGSYKLDGQEIADRSQKELALIRRDKIGFIFQSFHLLPKANALNNVALPMIYKKIHRKARKKLALKALSKVGLEQRAFHKPAEMSGGEQQRVAIARALVNGPSIILADEPTGNLDSKSGQSIMKLLVKLNKDGTTIVLVTHDANLASYTDRKIFLKDGKIVKDTR